MGNATELIKKVSKYQTRSNGENGAAYAIEKMVAVLIVSNLEHEDDHEFLMDGLEKWFGK